MRGPIVGIIAVFMLQLGVIGYGTVSRFFDASAEVAAVVTPAQPLAELSDLDFVALEPEQDVYTFVSTPPASAPEYARARIARRQAVKRPAVRTFETDFRPVTITVPTPSPYTFSAFEPQSPRTETPMTQASEPNGVNYETSARSVDVRRKRGFLAKTFTVIKKPYDWMKAVGSKLR